MWFFDSSRCETAADAWSCRPCEHGDANMSIDFWTKMALTVIALSLGVIAWKLPFADVGHAQMAACGSTSSAPCHIAINDDALKVQITNPQDFH